MQQECSYGSQQPPTDRRLSPRQRHSARVVYGWVRLRGPNLVPPSLEGLPARASRQSAAVHQVERAGGDGKVESSDFYNSALVRKQRSGKCWLIVSPSRWSQPFLIIKILVAFGCRFCVLSARSCHHLHTEVMDLINYC